MQKIRLLAGAVLLLALALGCGMEQPTPDQTGTPPQQQQPQQQPQQGAGSEVDLTVGDILENPDQYLGRTLAVRGNMGDMLEDNRIFTLNEGGMLGGDELLVGTSNPDMLKNGGLTEGDDIVVNGTVETFRLQDVERRFNVDLDDNRYSRFEGQPAIMAQNIQKADGAQDDAS